MTAQQEPEKMFGITESELQQWETVTKMSPVCQELRARIRSRGPIRQTEAPTPFITWQMKKCPIPSIHTRKLAINEIGNDDDGFSRLPSLPPIKEGDTICVYHGNYPLVEHDAAIYQHGYTDGQAKAAIENERIRAAIAARAREEVLGVVTQLYDAGFKNPLATVEAAIAYLQNPTVPGHPEKQSLRSEVKEP